MIVSRWLYNIISYSRLKSVGNNVRLSPWGSITRPQELEIGSNVFIARHYNISARDMKIGNDVMIGPRFMAECDDHKFDSIGHTMYSIQKHRKIAKIVIENDVWIGGNVTILKGVVVREGSIIGAGSVVTKSTTPYSINYGNPCKFRRNRFDDIQLKEHLNNVNSSYTLNSIKKSMRSD